MAKKVLLIGIDPHLIDFSNSPANINAEMIEAAGRETIEKLSSMGYEAYECLVDLGETAEAKILGVLASETFDCIMIGAGIRAITERTILFEKIINAVHQHARSARLCFNTRPDNTLEAVLRCLQP